MSNQTILTQYQSECIEALKSVASISKPFEKVFIDTMELFMAIPDKINFLQLGRYGRFSEQTYRNNFENEAFDWFRFNEYLINKTLTGKFRAIAIDPSYIPKSGKKTPWIGYFRSGVVGATKYGLELLDEGYHVVSRLRNDAVLFYPSCQKPTGKCGRHRLFDGKIDFKNLDMTRCIEQNVDKGRLFETKAYSKSLGRYIKVAIWFPMRIRLTNGNCISRLMRT